MKTEKIEKVEVAYMRNTGPYGEKNYELMERLKQHLNEYSKLDEETIIYGIALDNPSTTDENSLRYDVAYVTRDDNTYGLPTRYLDSAIYVIIEVDHTSEAINEFWKNIASTTKDMNVDWSIPILERYTLALIQNHRCEFCIPLRVDLNAVI